MNGLIAATAAVGCAGVASMAAIIGAPEAAAPSTDVTVEQPLDSATVLGNVLRDAATGAFGDDIIALEDEEYGFCAVFAPGTSPEYMQKWMDKIRSESSLRFEPNDRWGTFGAGNGPVSLTYSFPPDGTSLTAGNPGSNEMFTLWNAAFGPVGGESFWKQKFRESFDNWERYTGNVYTEVSDDGASWPGSPGPFNGGSNRGDIRITSRNIDGPGGVLAFNYFPDTGDMHMDSGDLTAGNYLSSNSNYRFLRNVVIHENGHGMGLSHSCPVQGNKLMEPFINTGFNGAQLDDILGMQVLYGDQFEPNNSTGAATPPTASGFIPDETNAIALLSIAPEPDLFRVTVSGESTLAVTVTPQSGTYLAGPQLSSGACSSGSTIDIGDNANLRIEILDESGAQIGLRDQNPAGQGETLPSFTLPASGDYYIRIGASDYQDIQMYSISVTIAGGGCPGDLNGDGAINGGDLGSLLGVWGPASNFPPADLNGDGVINGGDLGLLLGCWTG